MDKETLGQLLIDSLAKYNFKNYGSKLFYLELKDSIIILEQIFHNGGNDTTVGDDTGVLFDFGECIEHTLFHLYAAFAIWWDVGIVIPGEPCLVFRTIFQFFVAVHFKGAEVHFPETGIGFIRHIAKQNTNRFICPFHATGKETDIFNVVSDILQFLSACNGQGQVGTSAV